MKTKTQTPNPKYHNTAIFVGKDEKLREKAIKFYEENGYEGKYLEGREYIAVINSLSAFSDYSKSAIETLDCKIITLPETKKGVVKHKGNRSYLEEMSKGMFFYTDEAEKAAKFDSFEDFCFKVYPDAPVEAIGKAWEFIPLEEVNKVQSKGVVKHKGNSQFDKVMLENLSLRTLNCLKTADILTLQQLKSKTITELSLIRNLGKLCLQEIERFLLNQADYEKTKSEYPKWMNVGDFGAGLDKALVICEFEGRFVAQNKDNKLHFYAYEVAREIPPVELTTEELKKAYEVANNVIVKVKN